VQLGATAVISGVIAACAVIGYQKVRRKERIKHIKDEVAEIANEQKATMVGQSHFHLESKANVSTNS